MSKFPYSRVIGSLKYTMVCRKPDISQVASMVRSYMHYLGKGYW